MTHGSMLWGAALYNNGSPILSNEEIKQQRKTPLSAEQLTLATRVGQLLGESNSSDDAMDIDDRSAHFGVILATPGKTGSFFEETKYRNFGLKRLGFSSFHFSRNVARASVEDPLLLALMEAILHTPNTLRTHQVLARRLGCPLMRFNYWRPFQRYRMLCCVVMKKNGGSLITAFGHPLVWPAFEGGEGIVDIFVSFRAGVIPVNPDSIKLITYPMCDRVLVDINCRFVQTKDDFIDPSPHKPSIVIEPVPLDETNYTGPMHLLNEPIYNPDEIDTPAPTTKHSGADWIEELGGKAFLRGQHTLHGLADTRDERHAMSLIGYRSWAAYWDHRTNQYVTQSGAGPRQDDRMNGTNSSNTWNGLENQFPERPQIALLT